MRFIPETRIKALKKKKYEFSATTERAALTDFVILCQGLFQEVPHSSICLTNSIQEERQSLPSNF